MVFLFIFLIIIILALFSKIKIEIINLRFTSMTPRHLNKNYIIVIKFCILGKVPILKINITKSKLEKLKIKEKIRKAKIKFLEDNNKFDKRIFKALRKANIGIQKIKLKLEIGTENASMTSIIVGLLSTIIAIIFERKVKNYKNQKFEVNPVYINQNLINILISGIFEIKMIHIINIIYILNKKEGVKKYERTSNRRAYGYSYE